LVRRFRAVSMLLVEDCYKATARVLDNALHERLEGRTSPVGRLLGGSFRSLEQKIAKEKASS
jgi:hypothetical protein